MRRCRKCILPADYPSIEFDENGICNYCIEGEKSGAAVSQEKIQTCKEDFKRTVNESRGKAREYDCLVSLSGGKDSAYLAYLASKECKLRTLAFSVYTGFEGDIALRNIKQVVEKLDIDHMFFRPHEGFFAKLYAHLFMNLSVQGTVKGVCFACGPILAGFALKTAVMMDIPLVLHGYGPGQPPDTHCFYEYSQEHLRGDGSASGSLIREMLRHERFDDRDRGIVWNYEHFKDKPLPRVLMPIHIIDYTEEETIKVVEKLGLIRRGKASPLVTNCLLNYPMVEFHYKKLGYNAYVDFFSEIIRTGQASRVKWLWIDRVVYLMIKLGLWKRKEKRYVLDKIGLAEKDIIDRQWK